MAQQEHPFAHYVRILGKGRNGSRSFSQEEAETAMQLILRNEVEPIQLGAFLMLMRVKEESPEEVAGFVRAARAEMAPPSGLRADLDWSSYAGKRRHLPWFLLSTLLLAENGIRVFMHGASGHTAGRIYTQDVLATLGLRFATSWDEVTEDLEARNFAYFPLEHMSPKLHEIIQLRPLLGLRSPVHTLARLLNPLAAPYVMQGIFHPGYRPVHQEAALLLEQPHLAVIKGEGGEIEVNPDMTCLVQSVHDGALADEEWPPLFPQRHVKQPELEVGHLAALWHGELEDEYAEGAVISTVAVTLQMMGRAETRAAALAQARQMWQQRPREKYSQAA